MKKLLPLAFLGLAACLQPPVPGFEFNESVQSVDDSLPGGVTFVQNIPFISVTRVNEEPLTSADFNLAFTAVRQFCGAKGAAFSGNGTDRLHRRSRRHQLTRRSNKGLRSHASAKVLL